MHETALAKRILEVALAGLSEAGASRVLSVRGFIAETERLDPESLAFHFAAHARGTPAAGAELRLELVHVKARCRACGAVYEPEHHVTLCPECSSADAELLGETGFGVREIDVA
jgi:hydrogenase nickel incorporation protein HypA/HybF